MRYPCQAPNKVPSMNAQDADGSDAPRRNDGLPLPYSTASVIPAQGLTAASVQSKRKYASAHLEKCTP